MKGLMTPAPVRIASVYDDGEDTRHFTLEPVHQGAAVTAEPGQFFMLAVPGSGEAPFTYVRLPDTHGRFDMVVRRTGKLTHALFDRKQGDILGYRGPFGHGWPLNELQGRRVMVISGGCGLAPLAAVIDWLIEGRTTTALIYGARNPAAQVLARERALWAPKLPILETFDQTAPGVQRTGTPLTALGAATERLGGAPEIVLTCGPEAMMEAVARHFVDSGLPADRIWLSMERRMHCGVGLCGHCYIAHTYACRQGPTYRWDEISTLRQRAPSWPGHVREVRHC
ncbi:MAG: FAD/NAD(P)-binding protein [Deltaproteobacteria bacterium]|nr:FAD/NAD(P)-binding protein [Deltaproteobacteria bacterium]